MTITKKRGGKRHSCITLHLIMNDIVWVPFIFTNIVICLNNIFVIQVNSCGKLNLFMAPSKKLRSTILLAFDNPSLREFKDWLV
jgi:hypothetical protein